jgi:hypothetical protein
MFDVPETRSPEIVRWAVLAPLPCPFRHKFRTEEKKAL